MLAQYQRQVAFSGEVRVQKWDGKVVKAGCQVQKTLAWQGFELLEFIQVGGLRGLDCLSYLLEELFQLLRFLDGVWPKIRSHRSTARSGHAGALHIVNGTRAVIFPPNVPDRFPGHNLFVEFVV